MAGFDRRKRKKIQKVVSLPYADRTEDRSPSRRSDETSEGYDVVHDYRFGLLSGLVDLHGRVKDRAGAMTSTMIFLVCTATAMVPPIVAAGICHAAGASAGVTLWACGAVGLVFVVCSALVFLDARSARRAQLDAAGRARENRRSAQQVVHMSPANTPRPAKVKTKKPTRNRRHRRH